MFYSLSVIIVVSLIIGLPDYLSLEKSDFDSPILLKLIGSDGQFSGQF